MPTTNLLYQLTSELLQLAILELFLEGGQTNEKYTLAFLDEETLDRIASQKAAKAREVNGFEKLAEAHIAMRGIHDGPALWKALTSAAKWSSAQLEKLMEMDGPNSIVNLERALRARDYDRKAN